MEKLFRQCPGRPRELISSRETPMEQFGGGPRTGSSSQPHPRGHIEPLPNALQNFDSFFEQIFSDFSTSFGNAMPELFEPDDRRAVQARDARQDSHSARGGLLDTFMRSFVGGYAERDPVSEVPCLGGRGGGGCSMQTPTLDRQTETETTPPDVEKKVYDI
eukprot:GHVU01169594.1.p1 GENE.GHVU01169594.1~~GHVU01169594.1.p1  ORF type:complete len:161 (+),score=15.12 GHVU01169594.1:140-622(+)